MSPVSPPPGDGRDLDFNVLAGRSDSNPPDEDPEHVLLARCRDGSHEPLFEELGVGSNAHTHTRDFRNAHVSKFEDPLDNPRHFTQALETTSYDALLEIARPVLLRRLKDLPSIGVDRAMATSSLEIVQQSLEDVQNVHRAPQTDSVPGKLHEAVISAADSSRPGREIRRDAGVPFSLHNIPTTPGLIDFHRCEATSLAHHVHHGVLPLGTPLVKKALLG